MKGGPQKWDELDEKPVGIKRACISLDGTRIAAVFADKTLFIYDTTGEVILPTFKVNECPRSMIFSWNEKLVALGGRGLRLWNVETGKMVKIFDIKVCSLALSPDGTCIAAGCEGDIVLRCSNNRDRDVLDSSYNIRVINMGSVNIPDLHDPQLTSRPSGKGIKRLKGEILSSPFEGHQDDVMSVAYSADGKQIASCSSNDRRVKVWDISTGSKRTFESHSHRIHSVAFFSPDGTHIVSDTGLFNLSTGSFTSHKFGNKKKAYDTFYRIYNHEEITFSADGKFFASWSDTACQIWDIKSHDAIVQLSGHIHH